MSWVRNNELNATRLFVKVHDHPENALSDVANALRASLLPQFWQRLTALDKLVKQW